MEKTLKSGFLSVCGSWGDFAVSADEVQPQEQIEDSNSKNCLGYIRDISAIRIMRFATFVFFYYHLIFNISCKNKKIVDQENEVEDVALSAGEGRVSFDRFL